MRHCFGTNPVQSRKKSRDHEWKCEKLLFIIYIFHILFYFQLEKNRTWWLSAHENCMTKEKVRGGWIKKKEQGNKNELGKHFYCQCSGSTVTVGDAVRAESQFGWVLWREDGSYKKKVRMKKPVNKTHWKECEMKVGGRCNDTDTRVPRSSRGTSSLLSDCQGQFHPFLTFPVLFSLITQSACIKQAIWVIIKLFMPEPVNPIVFLSFLLIFTPSLQTNRLPIVYLSLPFVTRDINIFVGFGWYSLPVERHNSHSSTKHNN